MTTLSHQTSAKYYNDLPDVERANAEVRMDRRLDNFLADVGPEFVLTNTHSFAGVFLLHRHNLITIENRMVERDGFRGTEPALVTAPENIADDDEPVPIRWGHKDGRFIPIEYGVDSTLRGSYSALAENTEFLSMYADKLNEHGLSKHLGLCLYDRIFYRAQRPGCFLVEETDVDHSANVVFWEKGEPDEHRHIQTMWNFDVHAMPGPGCRPLCSRRCVMRSPGHAIEHYYIHGVIA